MPDEQEDFLDWSENQARPRRRQITFDLLVFGGLFALIGAFLAIIVLFCCGRR